MLHLEVLVNVSGQRCSTTEMSHNRSHNDRVAVFEDHECTKAPVSRNQKSHQTDGRKQSSGVHTVHGLPFPCNDEQEVPLTVEYINNEHQHEEPERQKRMPNMSVEYTNVGYVFEEEKRQRRTPLDSSSFCNTSERLSICVCACVVVEFRNKTLHGTVTVRQSPGPVHTCSNANQQPSVAPLATRERGVECKRKARVRRRTCSKSTEYSMTQKSRNNPTVFIQLEEQDVFLFGKLIKPTAHIIRRGSLLESDKAQHWRGRIESDALPGRATFRKQVFETLL